MLFKKLRMHLGKKPQESPRDDPGDSTPTTPPSSPASSSGSSGSSMTSSRSAAPQPPASRGLTQHANTSMSNFSTTSTLFEIVPAPQPPSASATYQDFLQSAARAEYEKMLRLRWLEQQRRQAAAASIWPQDARHSDPWRGGFGPSGSSGSGWSRASRARQDSRRDRWWH